MRKFIVFLIVLFAVFTLFVSCGAPEKISCYGGADKVTETFTPRP